MVLSSTSDFDVWLSSASLVEVLSPCGSYSQTVTAVKWQQTQNATTHCIQQITPGEVYMTLSSGNNWECKCQTAIHVYRCPHHHPGTWYSPTCRILALPQMDLQALAWVVPWHSSTPLDQRNCLVAARDFALLYVCARVCVCACMCVHSLH